MSYEARVFRELALPQKERLIPSLLLALLRHGGAVREFGSGDQQFSDEIADELSLTQKQRSATMQTLVRKENRLKTFPAWNRLLFRAADLAARRALISRPKETERLTGEREWMLTEKGIDRALQLVRVPVSEKTMLLTKTYEVQRVKKKLFRAPRPDEYNPIDETKKKKRTSTESFLRARGFRQAVIESYDYACALCGLKLPSPDFVGWEVEAAHIVPHRASGKDDLWNGIALCRLHHWTFDSGWFTMRSDFTVEVSQRIESLPKIYGCMGEYEFLRSLLQKEWRMRLPNDANYHPHTAAILWHRQNVFAL